MLWKGIFPHGVLVISVYGYAGEGLSQRYWTLLEALVRLVAAAGRPFIIAADWNITPQVLESTGVPQRMRGYIVHTGMPTYVVAEPESEIDFIVVSHHFKDAVDRAYVLDATGVKKHYPVQFDVRGDLKSGFRRLHAHSSTLRLCRGHVLQLAFRSRMMTLHPCLRIPLSSMSMSTT